MKCCDKRELYIEDDPRFTGEDLGWYVIMCKECSSADNFAYSSFCDACDRLDELKTIQQNNIEENQDNTQQIL